MNVNNKKEIIATALAHLIAISINTKNKSDREVFPKRFIEFFLKKINPNAFSDKYLIEKTDLHDFIDWNLMERKKVIRVLARDINLLCRFNLYKYNFSVIELYPIFLIYPDLISELDIDFQNLKTSEAILLLECDQNLVDKIDMFNYNFNNRDMLQIIKKFKNSEKIMNKLNLKSLDHFNTRKLICETGISYLGNLNLKNLKAIDWIDILLQRPELVDYCDMKLFTTNDCYLLTKFVIMFPDYEYMIYENIDKLSGLSWEYLLINDLEKYRDICKWEKLSENSWNKLIRYHPELRAEKQKYFLF